MKKCESCQKEYENKRDTSRFCSATCRVAFHRKNPGQKKPINALQAQVLYNSILEVVNTINLNNGQPPANSIAISTKGSTSKTMAQYFTEKRECESDEQYERWLTEVENDPILKSYQKQLLKTTNQ